MVATRGLAWFLQLRGALGFFVLVLRTAERGFLGAGSIQQAPGF